MQTTSYPMPPRCYPVVSDQLTACKASQAVLTRDAMLLGIRGFYYYSEAVFVRIILMMMDNHSAMA
jgi:hypothetical protein